MNDNKILNEPEYTEIEVSGWWNGRAYVDVEVADEIYNDFFDTDNLDETDRRMIMSISKDTAEGKDYGEIVPCSMLNEYAREQIKNQIMDGNMFGTIWIDGNDLQWNWEPECTLDGKEVDFQDDLSDASKEHIVNAMLEDECMQGEINEVIDIEVSIHEAKDFVFDNLDDPQVVYEDNGIKVETSGKTSENIASIENTGTETISLEFYDCEEELEPGEVMYLSADDDGYRMLGDIMSDNFNCDMIEPSLDDMLATAESRAAQTNDGKANKEKDFGMEP